MTSNNTKKMQMLIAILEGNILLIDDFNIHQPAIFGDSITILPSHVRRMLVKYLTGKISDFELNQWARFICLRGEYTVPGGDGDDDEISDFYGDMYYVIQCVSTPEIDGDIDEHSIQSYLDELNAKYPNDPPDELCITKWKS